MARIRTIKPEFFTSEDIVSLSPLARLLYIAIWCESDKEGRLVWKPVTFKLRYFPGDSCDMQAMCQEIIGAGLVVLYGEGYAVIPSFKAHQHINPRESESNLPEPTVPTKKARVVTRQSRDIDAQVGREGKGKEGNDEDATRVEVPEGFVGFWEAWPASDRKQAKGKCLEVWKKARAERDAAMVLAHVERMKASQEWRKNGGEFIPAPLVYLHQRRWEGAGESVEQPSIFARQS